MGTLQSQIESAADPARVAAADDVVLGEMPSERAAMVLCVRFGEALHRFGAAADRVEAAIGELARRLGLAVQVLAMPTWIQAAFGSNGQQTTFLTRVAPDANIDLGRLSDLDRLAADIAHGTVAIGAAQRRLAAILGAPRRGGQWQHAVAYAGVCGAAASLLGGGPVEIGFGGVLGFTFGVMVSRWGDHSRVAPVFPALTAFIAAAVARAAERSGLTQAPWLISLAALIVMVPGLMLTLAMREVTTGHLAAGSARATGALTRLLMLACGLALGDEAIVKVAAYVDVPSLSLSPYPLPRWADGVALAVSACGFSILFRARGRDFVAILVGCVAAIAGARLGDALLAPRFSALLGALSLGVVSNGFSRLRGRPAVLVGVPGLMLLVPGSLGVRSMSALLVDDVQSGVGTAVAASFVVVSLVSGLLLANWVVPPERTS